MLAVSALLCEQASGQADARRHGQDTSLCSPIRSYLTTRKPRNTLSAVSNLFL